MLQIDNLPGVLNVGGYAIVDVNKDGFDELKEYSWAQFDTLDLFALYRREYLLPYLG